MHEAGLCLKPSQCKSVIALQEACDSKQATGKSTLLLFLISHSADIENQDKSCSLLCGKQRELREKLGIIEGRGGCWLFLSRQE